MLPEIKNLELESCLGKQICVLYLEPGIKRSQSHFGVLQDFSVPWHLNLMFEYRISNSVTATHAVKKKSSFAFASEDGAIIRVVCENQVVFENPGLPDRYPNLDTRNPEDLAILNELRRSIWGDLYLYR